MYTSLGIISGTSMDAIDVAVIQTDGLANVDYLGSSTSHYAPALREELLQVAGNPTAEAMVRGGRLDSEVAQTFAHAIRQCLVECSLPPAAIDLVGCHGQTVLHDPGNKRTCQLADCAWLAKELGMPVVGDFRLADVAAGGQGAPFAPLYHAALLPRKLMPSAILNLGGVGNVTFVDEAALLAFDTGPANALMDDFMQSRLGQPFDAGGETAAQGVPVLELVREFEADPFFSKAPPKSLDRFHFHSWLQRIASLGNTEGMATLAALTVASVKLAMQHFPVVPASWFVTGGGRHNQHLMRSLEQGLQTSVKLVEAIGARGDSMEAEVFAYLAVRSVKELPLSLPSTTGVPQEKSGGKTYQF